MVRQELLLCSMVDVQNKAKHFEVLFAHVTAAIFVRFSELSSLLLLFDLCFDVNYVIPDRTFFFDGHGISQGNCFLFHMCFSFIGLFG